LIPPTFGAISIALPPAASTSAFTRSVRLVRSLIEQNADFAPIERRLHLADDGRAGEIHVNRRGCWSCRGGVIADRWQPAGELFVDIAQVNDARAHVLEYDLRKLEHQRRRDVRLLDRCLRTVEEPGLAVVIGEPLRTNPQLEGRISIAV
jgi:hypothetical protein